MPKIPRHKPAYVPDFSNVRNPSGDQEFYQSAAWRTARKWHIQANPICSACGADCTKLMMGVIDHIVAISAGGSRLHPDNLWTLCVDCHKWKTSMEKNGLTVAAYGEDGDKIPAASERERIKQLINEKRKYA